MIYSFVSLSVQSNEPISNIVVYLCEVVKKISLRNKLANLLTELIRIEKGESMDYELLSLIYQINDAILTKRINKTLTEILNQSGCFFSINRIAKLHKTTYLSHLH